MASNKIAAHFTNEDAARLFLESIRWPEGPICPKCGSARKPYALPKGKYRCSDKDCRSDFTVRVGTVFESSHIPLHQWLLAAYLLCSSKKGISSHQIHRTMGVTYKTAWFMTHRIREAMREGALLPIGGPGKTIEADETFIGRKPGRKKAAGPGHKMAVLSLVERGGRVRSFHIEDTRAASLAPIVNQNISHESHLMTDENPSYGRVGRVFKSHDTVAHKSEEYARYEKGRTISTNTIEGFFSIFKRGMTGIYQHCSEKHLHRYVAEFDFRYSEREVTDAQRTVQALRGSIGKRLTYRRTR
jgi:transposase-like protein